MTTTDIQSWLASVSPTVHQSSTSHHETKRRKLNHQPPSPPPPPNSDETDVIMTQSRAKRSRETDKTSEAPESESKRRPSIRSGDTTSEGSASRASSKQPRPSPNDQATEARLHTNGYEFVEFGNRKRRAPVALRQLINELHAISNTEASRANEIFEFTDDDEYRDEVSNTLWLLCILTLLAFTHGVH